MTLLSADTLWLFIAMLSAGACAGFTAGLFGIGGGFVVVPVLLIIFNKMGVVEDVAVHLAIGTSLATIITTSLRAARSHSKRNAVDFTVVKSWAPWIILGVVVGLVIASDANASLLVGVFGAGVLLLSVHFLFPNWLAHKRLNKTMPEGRAKATLATFLGGISALLGIGGGTITVLTMTLSNRPIHQAIGTASAFGALIAIPGTLGFIIIGWSKTGLPLGSLGYVNTIGWIAISAVSLLTAPLGAKLAHNLNPNMLKRAFGIYLVVTGSFMLQKSVTSMSSNSVSGNSDAVVSIQAFLY
ncbi:MULTISPECIES: sulfite exporter TauE/SafE family protein [unclassified Alteromonas]|uniref:sulfite exporter TauE/SafE family protein n=1 Tax=unclassified Alteromonas TaxID=2614992 RepID=UPI000AECA07E|nr:MULTISPECIES: sulfite exporter TauE/SafE family protein [unclassified Alteromonas]